MKTFAEVGNPFGSSNLGQRSLFEVRNKHLGYLHALPEEKLLIPGKSLEDGYAFINEFGINPFTKDRILFLHTPFGVLVFEGDFRKPIEHTALAIDIEPIQAEILTDPYFDITRLFREDCEHVLRQALINSKVSLYETTDMPLHIQNEFLRIIVNNTLESEKE